MKRGSAGPTRVDKEAKEREDPKADVVERMEETDLVDKTEGKTNMAMVPVATTGPFPLTQDLTLDVDGNPQALSTGNVHESLFMLKAREMAIGDLWFAKSLRDCADKWNLLVQSSGLLRDCGLGHPMDIGDCQSVHNLLGLWEYQVNPSKMCTTLRYLLLLYEKSGCRAVVQAQWTNDRRNCKARNSVWPYVPLALFPNQSVEEYLLLFAIAYFTSKRGHHDHGDHRSTTRTVAQWTNRLANYAEFRWKTLSQSIRSGGTQRLAQVCVLNAAAVTRKLVKLEAPYRLLPSTAIDKDGIPVRPDCSAFTLGEERKRTRVHAVMERSQRPRLEVPSGVSTSVEIPVTPVASTTSKLPSPQRPTSGSGSSGVAGQESSLALAQVRLGMRVEDLEGQNRELQAQNQEIRGRLHTLEKRLANYPREDLLRELRRENETTTAQVEEIRRHVDALWHWRKGN